MAKQNTGNDQLNAYYQEVYSAIEDKTMSDDFGQYVLHRVKGGQKTVFNKTQTEIRNFDMSFLDTIESVYPAILKIMRDPKRSIRYDEEVVSVEKARKVNSQTVRHLTSHTQLIKEITKEGDVIPSKVLTTYAEEEIAIYENRFIKTLVKRIEMFLERRYEVMKVSLESFETERLSVKNEFLMSGQKVTVDFDIQIKNDLTTNVETTKEQYNRLLYVREMIQGLKGTDFMRALAKARDVLPPIMKTNIILHNPDFKLCYGLWLYLDRVDSISTNIDSREKTYKYSNIFDRDINQCMALALTSFMKNRSVDGVHASKNLPTLKAPKPITNEGIELELNLNADNKKLEDYTMNQLLLEQTANFFEASLSGMQRTGNTYNESIRVVYRQMLDMVDQIYPKAFGVSDEQLESKDLYEQLEYARRRQMIIKIVRQQKQMNILRMAKEEKRIEKLLTTLDSKIKVQEEKERQRLEKQRQKEEAARLAAIAKEKALQEKKKRLEEEALARQKAADKKSMAKKKIHDADEIKKLEKQTRAMEIAAKRREHLKSIKGITDENIEVVENTQALDSSDDKELESAINAIPEATENAAEVTAADASKQAEDDEFLAALDAIPEASNEVEVATLEAVENVAEVESSDTTAEESSQAMADTNKQAEDDEFLAALDAIPEASDEVEVATLEAVENVTEVESSDTKAEEPSQAMADTSKQAEDDEFLAALDAIPEATSEAENQQAEDDEFLAALDAIPEATGEAENQQAEDDEFLAALDAIPEATGEVENQQAEDDEFLAALDAIPEVSEQEIVYVDENGNPIEGYDPSVLEAAADDYERMLRESGMTDEEIAALLGIDNNE